MSKKSPPSKQSEEENANLIEEKFTNRNPAFFTINGYSFKEDEFNAYSVELIHMALMDWTEGITTKLTQPNKILDIILKQIDGLSM